MTGHNQSVSPAQNFPDLRGELACFGLPPTLHQLNCLLSTAPVDLKNFRNAIQGNPDLVVETLKLCNSSLFNLSQPLSSLEQAVMVTGADIVRTLLLTCWLIKHAASKLPAHVNQLFWGHCLLVAKMSRRISEWLGLAQPEQAFLAGLLHDVGLLVLLSRFSRDSATEDVFKDLGEAIGPQRRRFGIDHCELGRQLGTALGFPLHFVDVFTKHHQCGISFSNPLVAIVGAAEQISRGWCPREHCPLPPAESRQLIREAFQKYLPSLSQPSSLHLVESLEADLLGDITPRAAGAWNIWGEDSF
ncbi:MAG: HDOD domain-containing protein [Terriglobia bacterium]